MKELLASFPNSEFGKFYVVLLSCWFLLIVGTMGAVLFSDKNRILQKEQNYVNYFFLSRRKMAVVHVFMWVIYVILFAGFGFLTALARRY